MKLFKSQASLALASLSAGQRVETRSFLESIIPAGGGYYDIITAGQFSGTPDEIGDITLANGNIAVLDKRAGVNVDQYGADPTGVADSFAAVQAAVDANKNVHFSEGTYTFSATVIIHNANGMNIQGAGEDSTVLTASTNLALNTSRISALGLADSGDYATNALFLITEYDGENDRPLFAARNHQFSGMTIDFEGTAAERVAHAFFAMNLAHTQWKDVKTTYCLSHFYGQIFSDERSRFFHLEWDNCRSIRNVHHCWTGSQSTAIVGVGTTWIMRNNSLSATDKGYEYFDLNYSTLDNCSVDDNKKGSYAICIQDCRGVNVITPGIETRYERAGSEFGGGILEISNSSVNIEGGFMVGGDRDGDGSGLISDFDNGSGTVVDSLFRIIGGSVVNWDFHVGDAYTDATQTSEWPIYMTGSGTSLTFTQGKSSFGASGDMDVNGNANCLHYDVDRVLTVIRGDSESRDFHYFNGMEVSYYDNSTCIANGSLDVDTFFGNRKYRVNQGAAGGNPEDYSLPAAASGGTLFGVLEVIDCNPYRVQRYSQTDGVVFSRTYGTSWSSWVKLSP